MEFSVSSLDELSPQELARLIGPGLKVCRSQVERDRFAQAMLTTARNQAVAATEFDDLWGELDYREVGKYIGDVVAKHLHGNEFHNFD